MYPAVDVLMNMMMMMLGVTGLLDAASKSASVVS